MVHFCVSFFLCLTSPLACVVFFCCYIFMGRFSQFRVAYSDDTESGDEPTLQPQAQQPSNTNGNRRANDGNSSEGSVQSGSGAKGIQSSQLATQVNEHAAHYQNYVFPPPHAAGEEVCASQHTPTQLVEAVVPPVSSPDPRNPGRPAAAAALSSSHRSHQSETPSAAQVSINAFPNKGMTPPAAPLAGPQPMAQENETGKADRDAEEKSRDVASHQSAFSSQPSKRKPASTRSSRSTAEADVPPPAPAAAGDLGSAHSSAAHAAVAESVLVTELSPQQGSEPAAEAPPSTSEAAAATATAAAPAASAVNASPQITVDLDVIPNPDAPEAAAAADGPRQKKVSAMCAPFSFKKKERKGVEGQQQAQASSTLPPKQKKASAMCGFISKKEKKADKKGTEQGGAEPSSVNPPADVAVNEATAAAAAASPSQAASDGQLSIPVAAGAGDGDEHHTESQSMHREGVTEETQDGVAVARPSETPTEATDAAPQANEAKNANALTSHTTSSLSFVINAESRNEHEEETEKAGKNAENEEVGEEGSVAPAEAAGVVAKEEGKPAKDGHVKRVKAVVRRRRQKPEDEAAAAAPAAETRKRSEKKQGGSEAHSLPHEEAEGKKAEEGESVEKPKQASKSESAARTTPKARASVEKASTTKGAAPAPPARASVEHSSKRSSHSPSQQTSPTHSSGYSSYSGSGSYSYSYSYSSSDSCTASDERDASSTPSRHSVSNAKRKAASKAHAAPVLPPPESSAVVSSQQFTQDTATSRRSNKPAAGAAPADGRFSRWSVRADDLVLREEEPPASMPAYQRRILLDLRARERRDAEEAARDLRELTFRPRIHSLPGQEMSRTNLIEEEERSHSPMGGGMRGRQVSPSFSPASGFSELLPRRYSVRQVSPHLLEPRQAPEQPVLPSFKPEISEYARKEVSHDRSVFQRLYNRSNPPSPVAAPEYSHKPEISEFAKQLYPAPRGGRLPGRHTENNNNSSNNDDSANRRESVFDRLYRQRNSLGTSLNTSPSRTAVHAPSFHPQITELAQRQSEGMPKEPVGERLYRNARSPRRESSTLFERNVDAAANNQTIDHHNLSNRSSELINGHRKHDGGGNGVTTAEESNINDDGEYDPQRDYATQREYGIGEVIPQIDQASWSSSSLSQSSFSVKGPTSIKEEVHRSFSARDAAVEAV